MSEIYPDEASELLARANSAFIKVSADVTDLLEKQLSFTECYLSKSDMLAIVQFVLSRIMTHSQFENLRL